MARQRPDWATWISMLTVVIACVVVGIQVVRPHADETPAAEAPEAIAAAAPAAPPPGPIPKSASHYKVNQPDATSKLSDKLDEISDLALAEDGKSFWAVDDERGTLFRIASADGDVVQTIEFKKKKGDFEGVALVNGKVFVGRSDGLLYVVDPKSEETTQVSTPLGVTCNLEGLAWQPQPGRLLLACKSPFGDKSKRWWGIWALDPATKKTTAEPVIKLTRKEIEAYLARHPEQPELKHTMATELDPSGIAVHPKTGELYLVSTKARLFMVLDPTGVVLRIEHLDRAVHPQPEGISFTADGTMFISSEGRGGTAVLNRFSPAPENGAPSSER